MKSAVIYARYSSEKQNEQSIEGQLRISNDYAKANDLIILDTYIDRAMTGTNDNRPAFQQMLADCEKPVPWDIVLVYAIDRFGRNSIEIAVNKQRLKKNHKTLISATHRTSDNLDGTKNLDGILLENMYIGLAEYYSAELSQKVRRGIRETRLKGCTNGGYMIFGYRSENKKILINEDEAPFVQRIFKEYANGKAAKTILRELTEQGVLRRGKPFALNTFYAILRNKKYIGIAEFSDGVYDNIYPPIISRQLFDEVQCLLAKNKLGSKSVTQEYLLRGICYCGYCGSRIQAECGTARDGSLKYYYKCVKRKRLNDCSKSTIKKDSIEELIIDTTLKLFSNQRNVFLIADAVLKVHETRIHNKSLLKILVKERNDYQKTLDNIMKAIEQGIITPTIKHRMEELEQKIAETNDKITIEECEIQCQISKEEVIQYLTHSVKYKPRLLFSTLIKKVILYDDKVEIYYNYIKRTSPDDTSPDENHREFFSLSGSTLELSAVPRKYNRTMDGCILFIRFFEYYPTLQKYAEF